MPAGSHPIGADGVRLTHPQVVGQARHGHQAAPGHQASELHRVVRHHGTSQARVHAIARQHHRGAHRLAVAQRHLHVLARLQHRLHPQAHMQSMRCTLTQSAQQHLLQIAAMDKPIRGTKSVSAILAQVKQFPALPRQAMAHLLAFGLAHDLAHGRLQTQVDQHPRAVGREL